MQSQVKTGSSPDQRRRVDVAVQQVVGVASSEVVYGFPPVPGV